MLYLKARHGFVEKDSSRDSAYGLSGLYIHLSKHHHHQLQTSSSSSSSTSTPSILISMLSLWWYLFCDSWQQNPDKRANSWAEAWNQQVLALDQVLCFSPKIFYLCCHPGGCSLMATPDNKPRYGFPLEKKKQQNCKNSFRKGRV